MAVGSFPTINLAHEAFEPSPFGFLDENDRSPAATTGCVGTDKQGQGRRLRHFDETGLPGTRQEMLRSNSTARAFIDYPSTCGPDETTADTSDHAATNAGVNDAMKNRISAYKKVIADVDSILETGDKADAAHNPLTVRAWFFNIGMAFDKVRLVHEATQQGHCESREERIEEILELFRQQNIITLAANVIRARQPSYSAEAAVKKAEQLVRDAYHNSIA